ncbi:MAG: DUF1566 domain-containing protein [Candidatus Scalindua sp. AMX11]|nr:MAG: DUF1566 domain-containing protein [Candidatus Scalindua sp. AMX11]GJQ59556.1 MAG: hypothetical protein SCALA701_23570 [Candidatus Scalindua sp.]
MNLQLSAHKLKARATILLTISFLTALLTSLICSTASAEKKGEPQVKLRSTCGNFADDSMVKKYNFYDKFDNMTGDFANDYELKIISGESVVIDHATGLMWHQSGSNQCLNWEDSKKWVSDLDIKGYAGYKDWRLPTMEEAASLLESKQMNGDLFIDPIFDKKQIWIWTGDSYVSGGAWLVHYGCGCVFWRSIGSRYVRPVRSLN